MGPWKTCPQTLNRTSQLLEEITDEEQGEKDEGFIDTLGEEGIVESLVLPSPADLPSLSPTVHSAVLDSGAPLIRPSSPSVPSVRFFVSN